MSESKTVPFVHGSMINFISIPLCAAVKAQSDIINHYYNGLKKFGCDTDSNIKFIRFYFSGHKKNMEINIPLLSMVNFSFLGLDTIDFDFQVETRTVRTIDQTGKSGKKNQQIQILGNLCSKGNMKKRSAFFGKYSFQITAKKYPASKIMERIKDNLNEHITAVTKP